ncbi:hypothetical protein QJ854_gp837 [Moumouvirus goulette]|uniref:BTB domain-containing protein n=1 Tax=Moumouvirus goulette TaxID=1247379 RepID=M1NLS9_9VIRU|nr:hypothetical protein QJ854_gp837 [Moumouvirus goulette]AGF84945.1 hypothetical protein glt_00136 [Moumouvirus goulette]
MDFSQILESEKLSDVELILVDKNNKKYFKFHKLILYVNSPFFEKMFDNFKEKNQSQIILEVFDVDVFSDIIKSFYKIKIPVNTNWKYQFANYMCRQYLLLECEFPKTLKIPEDEFEEFLNYTESIEYTDQMIDLVAENLPSDFDLNKLSIDLIKEMEKKYVDLQVLAINNKGINIVDMNNNKINNIIKGNFCSLDYIKDSDIIVTKSRGKAGYVFYDSTGTSIDLSKSKYKKYKYISENLHGEHFKHIDKLLIKSKESMEFYTYSPDYKKMAFVTGLISDDDDDEDEECYPRNIYIYDMETRKINKIYKISNKHSSRQILDEPLYIKERIIFSEGDYINLEVKMYSEIDETVKTICKNNDEGVIITYNQDDLILISNGKENKVYSLSKNKIVKKFKFECGLYGINFISSEIVFASKSKGNIYIYNVITGSLIKNIKMELNTEYSKTMSTINPIKNKLAQYLNNLDDKNN